MQFILFRENRNWTNSQYHPTPTWKIFNVLPCTRSEVVEIEKNCTHPCRKWKCCQFRLIKFSSSKGRLTLGHGPKNSVYQAILSHLTRIWAKILKTDFARGTYWADLQTSPFVQTVPQIGDPVHELAIYWPSFNLVFIGEIAEKFLNWSILGQLVDFTLSKTAFNMRHPNTRFGNCFY